MLQRRNTDLLEKCLLLPAYTISYNERKFWPHRSCQKEQPIHLCVTNTAMRTKGGFTSPSFWTLVIYKLTAIFLLDQHPWESRNHSERNPLSLASHPPMYHIKPPCSGSIIYIPSRLRSSLPLLHTHIPLGKAQKNQIPCLNSTAHPETLGVWVICDNHGNKILVSRTQC